MALHNAQETAADVFPSPINERPLPKRAMPDASAPPHVVHQLLCNELLLDGNAAQNLATFCTTWTDDEVRRLMDLCLDKNIVDKDEYPQTAEIESRCVNILAFLWRAPAGSDGPSLPWDAPPPAPARPPCSVASP